MQKWLILDCHYLCHRALHTTGTLSFNDVLTGVVFGFLRDISTFQEVHQTDRLVFCFDSKESKRRELYPPYKQKRREQVEQMDGEELRLWQEMRRQITNLRMEILPEIGFKNVFIQKGYEADDLIASVVLNSIDEADEAVIIGSDKDLYQLLTDRVSMWNPSKSKAITLRSFVTEYGITPDRWAEVKAYAGCNSDGVEGLEGIGEKTAAKYIAGKTNPKHKVHQKLVEGISTFKRNLPLVRLPFEGVETFDLEIDTVDEKRWTKVTTDLGMRSIRDSVPITGRARAKGVRPGGFGVV